MKQLSSPSSNFAINGQIGFKLHELHKYSRHITWKVDRALDFSAVSNLHSSAESVGRPAHVFTYFVWFFFFFLEFGASDFIHNSE